MDIFSKLITLDGGFGTELETVDGLDVENDHLWGCSTLFKDPGATIRVHKRFLDVGARLIETNTYQCTISRLAKFDGMTVEQAHEVIKTAVKLAREAIQLYKKEHPQCGPLYVGGSIGPFDNHLLEPSDTNYTGSYIDTADINEVYDYYLNQAKVLSEAGVDILCFETIPALKEAEAVLRVLDALPKSSLAWVAFNCKDGEHTGHGEKFSEVAEAMAKHPQVVAVGVNCTDPNFVSSLLRSAKGHTNGKPFVVYPNSGEVYKITEQKRGVWLDRPNKERMAVQDYVAEWVALGARGIGGCCRVYSTDIAKISKAMDKLEKN